jgi:hypothetical protein
MSFLHKIDFGRRAQTGSNRRHAAYKIQRKGYLVDAVEVGALVSGLAV